MFKVSLGGLGKKYIGHWVFRGLTQEWCSGQRIAIVGGNGSGKSTLVQVLSGIQPQSEGTLQYYNSDVEVPVNQYYQHIAMASPGLELPDSLSLKELLAFHLKVKPVVGNLDLYAVAERLDLGNELDKVIRLMSSGMRQRIKLGLALWADVPFILLDEPTSHLDAKYVSWYQNQLAEIGKQKLVVVASNEPREFLGFTEQIRMEDLKP
jgi:ABC-type multidrug transport system ATPase subunit